MKESQELVDLKKKNKELESHLDEVLGLYKPWSLKDVLAKLASASNILLLDKNYDGHGWEEISHCVDEAKSINELIVKIQECGRT